MTIECEPDIGKELHLPPPLISILQQRGFNSLNDVKEFLFPDLTSLPDPYLMRDVEKGTELVIEALHENKPVVVHGDYDVDGITATVIIMQFCRLLELETYYYIPNRLTDDYGLTIQSVDNITRIIDKREGLLITVDCGISSVHAVGYAREKGFKVIVTDHHEPPDTLPDADALINPKQENCLFPFKELSGAGVAFFFIHGLRKKLAQKNFWADKFEIPNLKQYLDLVALGTIADVMPLVDTNRILVKAGLEVLNQWQRQGISALCEVCGLHKADKVTPEDISFKLAPRINAAGRMGNAAEAVDLLLEKEQTACSRHAKKLDTLNAQRKQEELTILDEIFSQCRAEMKQNTQGLVIYNEKCHPGILGILASRVVEKFGVPAIVLTDDNKENDACIKGSGRSVKNINIYDKTACCEQFLNRFGGHPMAVGVSLHRDNLDSFRDAFTRQCQMPDDMDDEQSIVDYHIREKELISDELLSKLQLLQPFGEGNPEPVFLLKNETLQNVKEIRDHLKFTVDSKRKKEFTGIGFFMAEKKDLIKNGPVDIIFRVKRTSYRGVSRKEIQLLKVTPAACKNLT